MPADILRLDCHSRTTTSSTLFVLLRNDSGASYWLLVSPFAEDLGNKPHPPSRGARHPPPPHRAPRKQNLRGWILGRWAFIRPMRRIIVILPLLGGGINHPGPTTHKNCIFAGPGIGHPSTEGNLDRDGNVPSSPTEGNIVPRWGGLSLILMGGEHQQTVIYYAFQHIIWYQFRPMFVLY